MFDGLFRDFAGAVLGASALLLRNGAPIFATAYGLADIERQTPASTATNYRLASVSKQFTAMAALLLASERRLDDPLARFLRAPLLWQHITVEQLLAHTSGLLDYEELIAPSTSTHLTTRRP